jgi:hypothetical protein
MKELKNNFIGNIFIRWAQTETRDGQVKTGKIVTDPANTRAYRAPGGATLFDNYAAPFVVGQSYHMAVSRIGRKIAFEVDGKTLGEAELPADAPLNSGILGFRTWMNDVAIDDLKVTQLP